MGVASTRRAPSLGVRSARRHHQLRARRADLLRVARARDRRRGGGRGRLRSEPQGAVHRRSRRRLVAERRSGCKVSTSATVLESMLVTGFPYNVHQKADEFLKVFGAGAQAARARFAGSARRRSTSAGSPPGRMDGFWEASLKPWDTRAAALILEEAGGKVTRHGRRARGIPTRATSSRPTGCIHDEVLRILGVVGQASSLASPKPYVS